MGWEDNLNGASNSNSNFMQAFTAYTPRESYLTPSDFLMPTQQMNITMPGLGGNSGPQTSNMMTDIFGKDGKMGYANTALNLGQGLFSLWSGYQGLKQMRESAKLQRDQFAFNKAGLTSDYNSKLENKQRNMIAGLGGSANAQAMGVASIADQMKKYGV